MILDDIQSGSVIRYRFSWVDEAQRGEKEGRKVRPTAVGLRLPRADGHDLIVLFPITTQEPRPGRFAVEIPDIEKRRAGLDFDLRLWIVLDEYNTDLLGKSYDLEPAPPLGKLGRAFFLPLMRQFIARKDQMRGVDRQA